MAFADFAAQLAQRLYDQSAPPEVPFSSTPSGAASARLAGERGLFSSPPTFQVGGSEELSASAGGAVGIPQTFGLNVPVPFAGEPASRKISAATPQAQTPTPPSPVEAVSPIPFTQTAGGLELPYLPLPVNPLFNPLGAFQQLPQALEAVGKGYEALRQLPAIGDVLKKGEEIVQGYQEQIANPVAGLGIQAARERPIETAISPLVGAIPAREIESVVSGETTLPELLTPEGQLRAQTVPPPEVPPELAASADQKFKQGDILGAAGDIFKAVQQIGTAEYENANPIQQLAAGLLNDPLNFVGTGAISGAQKFRTVAQATGDIERITEGAPLLARVWNAFSPLPKAKAGELLGKEALGAVKDAQVLTRRIVNPLEWFQHTPLSKGIEFLNRVQDYVRPLAATEDISRAELVRIFGHASEAARRGEITPALQQVLSQQRITNSPDFQRMVNLALDFKPSQQSDQAYESAAKLAEAVSQWTQASRPTVKTLQDTLLTTKPFEELASDLPITYQGAFNRFRKTLEGYNTGKGTASELRQAAQQLSRDVEQISKLELTADFVDHGARVIQQFSNFPEAQFLEKFVNKIRPLEYTLFLATNPHSVVVNKLGNWLMLGIHGASPTETIRDIKTYFGRAYGATDINQIIGGVGDALKAVDPRYTANAPYGGTLPKILSNNPLARWWDKSEKEANLRAYATGFRRAYEQALRYGDTLPRLPAEIEQAILAAKGQRGLRSVIRRLESAVNVEEVRQALKDPFPVWKAYADVLAPELEAVFRKAGIEMPVTPDLLEHLIHGATGDRVNEALANAIRRARKGEDFLQALEAERAAIRQTSGLSDLEGRRKAADWRADLVASQDDARKRFWDRLPKDKLNLVSRQQEEFVRRVGRYPSVDELELMARNESGDMDNVIPPESKPASVPLMVTREMERRLGLLGYSQDAIHKLTPQEASDILREGRRGSGSPVSRVQSVQTRFPLGSHIEFDDIGSISRTKRTVGEVIGYKVDPITGEVFTEVRVGQGSQFVGDVDNPRLVNPPSQTQTASGLRGLNTAAGQTASGLLTPEVQTEGLTARLDALKARLARQRAEQTQPKVDSGFLRIMLAVAQSDPVRLPKVQWSQAAVESFTDEQRLLNAQELINTARGAGQKWADALIDLLQDRAAYEWYNLERRANPDAVLDLLAQSDAQIRLLSEGEKGLELDELTKPYANNPRAASVGKYFQQWYADRGLQFPRQPGRARTPRAARVPAPEGEAVGRAEQTGAAARKTGAASNLAHLLPEMQRSPGLDDAQRAIEAKYIKDVQENTARYLAEYQKRFGNFISADNARELFPEYRADAARHTLTVGAPAYGVARAVFRDILSKPVGEKDVVVFLVGGGGAGKTTAVNAFRQRTSAQTARTALDNAEMVYETLWRTPQQAQQDIDEVLEAGRRVSVIYVHRPIEQAAAAVLDRTARNRRVYPVDRLASGHYQAQETLRELTKLYSEQDVAFAVIDNSGTINQARMVDVNLLSQPDVQYTNAADVEARARKAMRDEYERRAGTSEAIPQDLYDATLKASTQRDYARDRGIVVGRAEGGSAKGAGAETGAAQAGEPVGLLEDVLARLKPPEAVADPTLKGDLEAALADELLRLLEPHVIQDAGNFGGRALPSYLNASIERYIRQVEPLQREAKQAANAVGRWYQAHTVLNYANRWNFDDAMSLWGPFTFYPIHMAANLGQEFIDRPALFTAYVRLLQSFDDYAKKHLPKRFAHRIMLPLPFLPEWMGGGIAFDPFAMVNPRSIYGLDAVERATYATLGGEEAQPIDTPSLLADMYSPHLPYKLAYYLLTGDKASIEDTLANLPFVRQAKAFGLVNYNTDIAGLKPFRSKWDDFYVDRALRDLVAEGALTPEGMTIAKLSRKGEAWQMALERARLQNYTVPILSGYTGFTGKLYTAGEQKYNLTRLEYDRLKEQRAQELGASPDLTDEQRDTFLYNAGEWDEGGVLRQFKDAHPELGAGAAFAEDEKLYRDWLIDQVRDKYYGASELRKKLIAADFGEPFVSLFRNRDTRDYDDIPKNTLLGWAIALGVGLPDTSANPEVAPITPDLRSENPYRVNFPTPQQESAYQEYYDEVEREIGWDQVDKWGAYQASLGRSAKNAWFKTPEGLRYKAYLEYRDEFLKENSDIAQILERAGLQKPTPTFQVGETASGLTQQEVTQGSALNQAVQAMGLTWDEVDALKAEYYALPNGTGARSRYLADHPKLLRYFQVSGALYNSDRWRSLRPGRSAELRQTYAPREVQYNYHPRFQRFENYRNYGPGYTPRVSLSYRDIWRGFGVNYGKSTAPPLTRTQSKWNDRTPRRIMPRGGN